MHIKIPIFITLLHFFIIVMAKRSATSALNQDNWDKEEEAEEAGVFETASSEVLQTRVIKTAKRRIRQPEYNAETKPSPFSNFTGFGKATSTSKSGQNTVASPFSSFLFKSSQQETKESEKKPNNLELLKDLNLSCSSWIAEHLEKNPFCILTPIFKDYEKHLKELNLDNELEKNNAKTEPEKPASADNSNKETPKTFSFNKEETTQSSEEEKKKPEKEKLNEFKFEGFQPMKPLNPLFGSKCLEFYVKKMTKK